ncbi:MAG: hypothetical protein HGA62_05140 [Chlorobiaceae bacterium]|nr:hypothetical protein [Chlorobiaceae bacterium]NTV61826.1 hypothetical protein [Chlorobiaceae bacterium]
MNFARPFHKGSFITLLFVFITLLSASSASGENTAAPRQEQSGQTDRKELIYTLHHAVIPGILFSDKGAMFFGDLTSGNNAPFHQIVEGPLGKDYASGMKIIPEHYPDFDIVLISFPVPVEEPHNVHAALVKKNGTFRYITLEKGNDVGNLGTKTFMCEWSADHNHKNYGARKYDDLESFRKELLDFLKK